MGHDHEPLPGHYNITIGHWLKNMKFYEDRDLRPGDMVRYENRKKKKDKKF